MPDDIERKVKFSDLPSATSVDSTNRTLLVQGVGGGEITKTTTVENISNYIVKDAQYPELTTTNKKIIAAINEAATSGTEILCGTSAPTSSQGENNNLYIQYTAGVGGASDVVDALFVKLDGAWCSIDVGGGSEALNDLTDVSAASPSNNEVVMWDSDNNNWENKPIYIGNDITYGNIQDVVIDDLSLFDRQTLLFNGDDSVWENGTLCLGHTNMSSDFDDVYLTQTIANKDLLIYDSTNNRWANSQLYREITGTLTIGSTSVVLTNTYTDVTVANASLEVFTDTFGVNPTDIAISGDNISLTFEAQSSTVNVKVRLWK